MEKPPVCHMGHPLEGIGGSRLNWGPEGETEMQPVPYGERGGKGRVT